MHFIAFARPNGAGGYGVEFPDAPGCVSAGRDLADTATQAAEALAGWLEVSLDYGDVLSLPRTRHRTPKGATRLDVPVATELAVRLTLRAGRIARGLSQAQLATQLGMTPQAVQKLERAGTNPTVATLERVSAVLGAPFVIGSVGDASALARPSARAAGTSQRGIARRVTRDAARARKQRAMKKGTAAARRKAARTG